MAKSASKGGSGGPAGGGGSSGTGEKRNSMLPAKRRSARRNPAAKAAPSRPSPSAVPVRPAKNKSATSVWMKGCAAPPTGAEKADRRRAAKNKKPLASGKSTPGEVIKPNPKTPKTAAGGTNKKKGATSSTAKPKSSHSIMSTSLVMGGQLLGENHPRKMDEDAFQVDDDCSSDDDLFPKLEPLSSLAKQAKSRETSSLQPEPKSRETKQHKKGLAFSSSSAACQGACSAAGPMVSASKSSGSALWAAKACSGASASSGGILSKARSAAGPGNSSLSTSRYFFAAGGAGGASSSSSSWKGSTTKHDQYSYAPNKMPSGKTTATSSGAANMKPAALAAQLQAAPSRSTMIHPPKNHTKNAKKELRAASYLEAMNFEDEDVDEESCYMDSEDESDEDSDSFDNYPLIRCRECRLIEKGVITEDFEHACFFVRSPTAGDKDVCLPVDVLSLDSSSPSSSSSRGEGWRLRGTKPKGVAAMEVDE